MPSTRIYSKVSLYPACVFMLMQNDCLNLWRYAVFYDFWCKFAHLSSYRMSWGRTENTPSASHTSMILCTTWCVDKDLPNGKIWTEYIKQFKPDNGHCKVQASIDDDLAENWDRWFMKIGAIRRIATTCAQHSL